jgi:uncharacterized OsmC-like protein
MTTNITSYLNDVDIESVGGLVQSVQAEPHRAHTTWAATVEWKGGFRSESRVRDFHPVQSDEPTGLGGTDTAANPVEQLLSAFGNCLAVGYAANASAAGVEITNLRIELDGDLDLHTFLGLADDGHAGFKGINARVHLELDAEPDQIEALHRKVIGTSPVGHTLSRAIPLDVTLV